MLKTIFQILRLVGKLLLQSILYKLLSHHFLQQYNSKSLSRSILQGTLISFAIVAILSLMVTHILPTRQVKQEFLNINNILTLPQGRLLGNPIYELQRQRQFQKQQQLTSFVYCQLHIHNTGILYIAGERVTLMSSRIINQLRHTFVKLQFS